MAPVYPAPDSCAVWRGQNAQSRSRLVRELKRSLFLGHFRIAPSPRKEAGRSWQDLEWHLGRSFRIMLPENRADLLRVHPIALPWPPNSGSATIGIRPEFESLGSRAVVAVQHAAQPLAALDLTGVADMARLWTDEPCRSIFRTMRHGPVWSPSQHVQDIGL